MDAPTPDKTRFDAHTRPREYVTGDVPGTGGVLKSRAEDFLVEEIPAYEPCGSGEHLYLWVEKREVATMHLVRMLAEHFGVRREAVGVAGLKDKLAVTRQLVSVHVPGKKDTDFSPFERPGVKVLWVDRHANKLRRGHLKGNRFVVRVRGCGASKAVYAHKTLARLAETGVPNRIGTQRFGVLGNNHVVGRALVLEDWGGAADALLGPNAEHPESQGEARRLYAAGQYADALAMMARGCHTERRVLAALARGAGVKGAVRAIERIEHSFYVTAMQSAVFNAVLDERIGAGRLGELGEGDLAFKHDSGAVFAVGARELEGAGLRERLARLEISPSGPMWGHGMTRALGAVDSAERGALERAGVRVEDLERFDARSRDPVPGQRRALRVPVMYPDVEGGMDEHGEYVRCTFELARGCFATTVMQEVMKPEGALKEEEGE